MLCAVGWVRRGCARPQVPTGDRQPTETVPEPTPERPDDDSDDDVDISSVLADGLESLRVVRDKENAMEDGGRDDEDEDEERDDIEVRLSDAIILTARSDEEASYLEMYLYEDDEVEPNLYRHHDIPLPTFPLCLAWTSTIPLQQADASRQGSFCATGTFLPGIDVWDMDDMESMEPVVSLGGFAPPPAGSTSKRKKKKNPANADMSSMPLAEGSHSAAVMSLSWNPLDAEYLASGSADNLVKCWDVESASCVQTISTHQDKVQSVAWHPTERGCLLTGAFDKEAHVVDARAGTSTASVKIDSDVETGAWRPSRPSEFVVAAESGNVFAFDSRMLGGRSQQSSGGPNKLWTLKAHSEAASGFSLSEELPDIMATGSISKTVKIWDIGTSAGTPELLWEGSGRAGAIFGLSFCADGGSSPFLLAAVGDNGKLSILDTALLSERVRDRFQGDASAAVSAARARAEALANAPERNEESEGEDSDDSS